MESRFSVKHLLLAMPVFLAGCSTPFQSAEVTHPNLEPVGRYASGVYHNAAAEIVAWHKASQSIYVVNAGDRTIDILSARSLNSVPLANPILDSNIQKTGAIDIQPLIPEIPLGAANSVAVHDDLLAVAVENRNKQGKGVVVLFALDGEGKATFKDYAVVGALPDMVTFTPDGNYLLTANEGDARDYWYKTATEKECMATGGLKYDDEDGCLGFTECIFWPVVNAHSGQA